MNARREEGLPSRNMSHVSGAMGRVQGGGFFPATESMSDVGEECHGQDRAWVRDVDFKHRHAGQKFGARATWIVDGVAGSGALTKKVF